MRKMTAGAIGGVVAGMILSGVTAVGRDAGLLHKTLAGRASDWLDRRFNTDAWGVDGTQALEETNHLAAAAAFGAVYGATRPLTQSVPPVAAGALFGAGLYAVSLAGAGSSLGSTQDGDSDRGAGRLQRFGLHLLFGVITALVADALAPIRPASEAKSKPMPKAPVVDLADLEKAEGAAKA